MIPHCTTADYLCDLNQAQLATRTYDKRELGRTKRCWKRLNTMGSTLFFEPSGEAKVKRRTRLNLGGTDGVSPRILVSCLYRCMIWIPVFGMDVGRDLSLLYFSGSDLDI